MKIYALQSMGATLPNVFLSAYATKGYLVIAEYEVDITLPSDEEVKEALDNYFESERAQKIAFLRDQLKQLEGAA